MFGFGGEALHNTIRHVLLLAYDLLDRPVSAQILKVGRAGLVTTPTDGSAVNATEMYVAMGSFLVRCT